MVLDPPSDFSTEQHTANLSQILRQPQRFCRRHLANSLPRTGLGHPYYQSPTVIIQLKLNLAPSRLGVTLHLRHRLQYKLAIRIGHAVIRARLGNLMGYGRGFYFIRCGSRRRRSRTTPAGKYSHLHGLSSEQDKAGEELPLPPPGYTASLSLAQQAQDRLRQLVGLGQHGSTGLLHDLVLGQLGRLCRVVCVHDTAAGSRHVLGNILQVTDGGLKAVLYRPDVSALRIDALQCGINHFNSLLRSFCSGDIDIGNRVDLRASTRAIKYLITGTGNAKSAWTAQLNLTD